MGRLTPLPTCLGIPRAGVLSGHSRRVFFEPDATLGFIGPVDQVSKTAARAVVASSRLPIIPVDGQGIEGRPIFFSAPMSEFIQVGTGIAVESGIPRACAEFGIRKA